MSRGFARTADLLTRIERELAGRPDVLLDLVRRHGAAALAGMAEEEAAALVVEMWEEAREIRDSPSPVAKTP